MKPYQYAVTMINVILLLFFLWLFWVGNTYLPDQLDSEMQSDVMLQKYENVCADLTASLLIRLLIVIVLVNAVLIKVYFSFKKNPPSQAGSNQANQET